MQSMSLCIGDRNNVRLLNPEDGSTSITIPRDFILSSFSYVSVFLYFCISHIVRLCTETARVTVKRRCMLDKQEDDICNFKLNVQCDLQVRLRKQHTNIPRRIQRILLNAHNARDNHMIRNRGQR